MNNLTKAKQVLLRLLGVVLVASVCILLSTGMHPPEMLEAESLPHSIETPTEYEPEVSPEPALPAEPEFFEMSFVGDNTLASTIYNKPLAISYENVVGDDFAYPFSLTAHYFRDDDFTFANLECVLTTNTSAGDKNFTFRCDPSYVNILKEGSVEFVSLGNNHVLDFGEEGYAEMKTILDDAGIAYAGRDEWNIYETESGLKIGVYALSFGNVSQIQAGIAALKEAGAEFIVAALHWGDEGSYKVNNLQYTLGRAAIDAGADFVYGSHPHTLQPYEEYNGKFIYYSLGNWSFGGNTAPRDPDTIILKLTVMRDIDGTVSVIDRTHIPCACTGKTGGNDYRPVPYEPGTPEYDRTLSKIDGSFAGADLTINYEYNFNEY